MRLDKWAVTAGSFTGSCIAGDVEASEVPAPAQALLDSNERNLDLSWRKIGLNPDTVLHLGRPGNLLKAQR